MLIIDEIVDSSELIYSYLASYKKISENIDRHTSTLSALLELSLSSNHSSDIQYGAKHKIVELSKIVPFINQMYEYELSFKIDSIEDISVVDNEDLFSSILTSWINGVYVEPSTLTHIYSLTL